jgi:hypothetical protein
VKRLKLLFSSILMCSECYPTIVWFVYMSLTYYVTLNLKHPSGGKHSMKPKFRVTSGRQTPEHVGNQRTISDRRKLLLKLYLVALQGFLDTFDTLLTVGLAEIL